MAEFQRDGCKVEVYRDHWGPGATFYDTILNDYKSEINPNRWRVWATLPKAPDQPDPTRQIQAPVHYFGQVTSRRVYLSQAIEGPPPSDDAVLDLLRDSLRLEPAEYGDIRVLVSYSEHRYGVLVQARIRNTPPMNRRLEMLLA